MIPASCFALVSSRRFVTPASFCFCFAVSFREIVELHIKQAASCSVQYILSNDASFNRIVSKYRKMLESIDMITSSSSAPEQSDPYGYFQTEGIGSICLAHSKSLPCSVSSTTLIGMPLSLLDPVSDFNCRMRCSASHQNIFQFPSVTKPLLRS